MTEKRPAQNAIRAMNRARRTSSETCPASRHAALIAETVVTSNYRTCDIAGRMVDSNNFAVSLATVVSSLFEARHALAALAPEWANSTSGWWWTTPRGKAHLRRMAALGTTRKVIAGGA